MNRLKMEQLPAKKEFQTGIRRAPRRELNLTPREMRLAVSGERQREDRAKLPSQVFHRSSLLY